MDIRIARTDRAIEQAFMELREKNPLEKIKILYRRKADKQQGIGTMGILTFRLQNARL